MGHAAVVIDTYGAFMSKYQSLTFLFDDISGSRVPALFLFDDGESTKVPDRRVMPFSTRCAFISEKFASL